MTMFPKEIITNLFEIIKGDAYNFRRENPGGDGKAFWQPIKAKFDAYDDIVVGHWKPPLATIVYWLPLHPEFDDNNVMIEQNHFIHQLNRIPTTAPCTIKKIMQLALNIGQLKAATTKFDDLTFLIDDFVIIS